MEEEEVDLGLRKMIRRLEKVGEEQEGWLVLPRLAQSREEQEQQGEQGKQVGAKLPTQQRRQDQEEQVPPQAQKQVRGR